MIVVKVELWSAITGNKTELARMHISNDGTSTKATQGNYDGTTFIGRDSTALDRGTVSKTGRLTKWPRLQKHIWCMVQAMLTDMGYSK